MFPGARLAVTNVPITVPRQFLGRDDVLAEIKTALSRDEGRVAVTTLHGLRGIGKTTLAAAFAERHRSDYRATWWIRAQSESTMRADRGAWRAILAWIASDEKEEPALAAVMERLRHEGEGILLIFDSAVDAMRLEITCREVAAVKCLSRRAPVRGAGSRYAGRNQCLAQRSWR